MRPIVRSLAALLLLLSFRVTAVSAETPADAAASAPAVGPAVQETLACMRRNLPATTLRQEVRLERTGPSGTAPAIEAELFWKRGEDDRSRVLLRVSNPSSLRGFAFLAIEREGDPDLFTYLPELRNVRRITARTISGSVAGTDFSYEDLLRLQAITDRARVERLPDAELEGRPMQVLAASPAPDSGSAYGRIVTWVDAETCVPVRTEFHSEDGALVKEMTVSPERVEPAGDRQVPREIVMRDLERDSQTRLVVESIELDPELSDSLFSQSALSKGR